MGSKRPARRKNIWQRRDLVRQVLAVCRVEATEETKEVRGAGNWDGAGGGEQGQTRGVWWGST